MLAENPTSPSFEKAQVRAITALSALLACALGLSVLLGWTLGVPRLTNIEPTWPAIAPLTAVEFVLSGACLGWLFMMPSVRGSGRAGETGTLALAAAVGLIALVRLGAYLLDWDWRGDLIGFRDDTVPATAGPVRMAPLAATAFVVLGAALSQGQTSRRVGLYQALALVTTFIGLLALGQYLFGGATLPYSKVAVHTAVGLIVLGIGTLCARPDGQIIALLSSDSMGGVLGRRLLIPTLVVPFALSAMRLISRRHGWLDAGTEASIFAVWNAAMFGVIAWVIALLIHRSDLSRRRTEAELRAYANRLSAVIETEPECVKIVDSEGRLLEINRAGLAMLEVDSLGAARQCTLAEYILPSHRPAFVALHRKVLSGGSGVLQFEIEGREGTRRWVETHAAPLRDSSGKVIALLGISRDVTESKRSEATRAQAQLFRELLDRSNELIYIADAESGRVLDCNATLPKRLGYQYREVLELTISELSDAAGQSGDWPERLKQLHASGSQVIESHYRCKDGGELPVEVALSYVGREPRPLLIAVSRDMTERQRQEARILHLTRILRMQSAIGAAVLRTEDRDQLLQEACRITAEVGAYDQVVLSIVERGSREARIAYQAGRSDFPPPKTRSIPIGDGSEPDVSVTGRALRTGEVIIADVRHSEPSESVRTRLLGERIHWIIVLPLKVAGEVVGAVTLLSSNPEPVGDEELRLLQDVAGTLAFGLRSLHHADAAQFLTYYDALTGLANRALFCERVGELLARWPAVSSARPVLIVLDMQDLSSVNDTYGRAIGDGVLRELAERLKEIESDHHVGYLGTGTFALITSETGGTTESLIGTIERDIFGRPFNIDGRSFRISYHSGLARFPVDGTDASTLVQRAEAALRHAKESGEQYVHYDFQMHSEVSERLRLEHQLRDAIEAGQFLLHYQPQVSIETGRIESVEALLRWRETSVSFATPTRFLPILESSGLIVAAGAWVLEQAARDLAQLRRAGFGPLRIAVNISALQIRRRRIVEDILSIIENVAGDGYAFDLEITETSLLQELEDTRRKLRRLRAAGLRIAIDDFGTGYSSLGLLPTLPADILKIDRVFIRGLPSDPASVALTSSIIRVAATFDLVTVAEGVETEEQLELLRSFGCDQVQGYLHARPMPLEELERFLRSA